MNLKDAELILKATETAGNVLNVSIKAMGGNARLQRIVFARYFVFKFMRENSNLSLSEIGKTFNKDHGTVLNGIKKLNEALDQNYNGYRIDWSNFIDMVSGCKIDEIDFLTNIIKNHIEAGLNYRSLAIKILSLK